MTIAFNRGVKQLQRSRAAARADVARVDALRDEIARRVVERLRDIKSASHTFPVALDYGANTGNVVKALSDGVGGIRTLYMLESNRDMLYRDEVAWSQRRDVSVIPLHGDEEAPLPLPDDSVDLVLSSMSMHWVNDLPRMMANAFRVLRPDGVFLAAMLGGDTLAELRSAFMLGEMEREGGVSAHTSPMIGVGDAGSLLTTAGFALPTVDTDMLAIEYEDAGVLFEHLRAMGESNAALMRRSDGAHHDALLAATAAYHSLYSQPDGVVSATYQVIYMIGWKPAASQPTPLRRGSVPKGFAAKDTKA